MRARTPSRTSTLSSARKTVMAETLSPLGSLMVSQYWFPDDVLNRGQTPHFEGVLDPRYSVRYHYLPESSRPRRWSHAIPELSHITVLDSLRSDSRRNPIALRSRDGALRPRAARRYRRSRRTSTK